LEELERWILKDECRLVSIVGFGGTGKTSLSIELAGVGKTALSEQLANKICSNFDYVIWRSLYSAPPIEEILTGIIKFVSDQQDVETSEHSIARLVTYLQEYRCLLIFDNVEDIFQAGKHAGNYRKNRKEYGLLFEKLAEISAPFISL
jgi:predicted ATPase